jgi:hypothetical protein
MILFPPFIGNLGVLLSERLDKFRVLDNSLIWYDLSGENILLPLIYPDRNIRFGLPHMLNPFPHPLNVHIEESRQISPRCYLQFEDGADPIRQCEPVWLVFPR